MSLKMTFAVYFLLFISINFAIVFGTKPTANPEFPLLKRKEMIEAVEKATYYEQIRPDLLLAIEKQAIKKGQRINGKKLKNQPLSHEIVISTLNNEFQALLKKNEPMSPEKKKEVTHLFHEALKEIRCLPDPIPPKKFRKAMKKLWKNAKNAPINAAVGIASVFQGVYLIFDKLGLALISSIRGIIYRVRDGAKNLF